MSFFDKIYDITHTDLFKYVFYSGSDEIFVANVSKISTFNENVLDSKSHIQAGRHDATPSETTWLPTEWSSVTGYRDLVWQALTALMVITCPALLQFIFW